MNTSTIFVSPNGNDNWSGALPEANSDHSDGPLLTLTAAQRAVRARRRELAKPEEIQVVLRGGLYELDEPWFFAKRDSGFGRDDTIWPRQAKTWPVVWSAYENETPVISGGRKINGPWQEETVNGKTAWTTQLNVDRPFTQLWVNGERRLRPRLPKDGVRQVAAAVDPDFDTHGHRDSAHAFKFQPGELKSDWHNLNDVELRFFGWWLDRTVKLASVDEDECLATFDRDARLRLEWGPGDGIDYIVENVFEALTEPGEWYFDRHTKKLYYLPMPGETPDTVEVIVAQQDSLLHIDGAANLCFEGLTFAHSEWTLPDGISGTQQAAIHVPGALQLRGVDNVTFADCRVEHVGTYGADVLDDSIETVFDHCTFMDLGGGGVRIWHGCRRNALLDCEIGDGGHRFACAVGVLIGKATGNRVVHCHIHDFYYTGISVGWNWGYAESDGYGNIIEWNHIHDIGKELLSDMGGIYLLGHAPGTRLRYNHIHDIECRRYGGWCIYTDEGSSDVLVESNLCYNANRTAYNQHYGRNNLIRNNIFAYGGDAVLSYGRPESHVGLIFENNILLSADTPILRGATPDRWTPQQTVFRDNLYWCETGPVRFERGGASMYGTQAFPDGYAATAGKFRKLRDLPTAADGAWTIDRLVNASGSNAAPAGAVDLRLRRDSDELVISGSCLRPPKAESLAGALWSREHVELFLKPFADGAGMVQLGLAADGETDMVWHDCDESEGFAWQASADMQDDCWYVEMRIPLLPIAAAAGGAGDPDWGILLGLAVAAEIGDFESWQKQGHDPSGCVANPQFADPASGNFTLAPNSPAFDLGFVPFDVGKAGVRP